MKTASLAPTEPSAAAAEMPRTAVLRNQDQRSRDQQGRDQRSGNSRRDSNRDRSGARPRSPHAWVAAAAIFILILLALLAACSSNSGKPAEPTKPEAKPPELITARSAFQKTFVAARGWAQDAKPYRLESIVTSDGNGHDGKWALWRGSFASAALRSAKSYTWSGSAADGAPPRGVNPGIEDSYSPTNASTRVFDIAFLKIDSDQALATAQKHGGTEVLEKAPDTPVFYVCDWNNVTNRLIWHVAYGASREEAKLTIAVDASTGDFIREEK